MLQACSGGSESGCSVVESLVGEASAPAPSPPTAATTAVEEETLPPAAPPATAPTVGVHTVRLSLLDSLTPRLESLPSLGGLAAIPTLQVRARLVSIGFLL